jgi:hypothetical protein
MEDLSIIKLNYINKASLNKPEVVPVLLKSYQWKLPRALEAMREAWDNKLAHQLGLVAFQVKEILPVLGIREISIELAELAKDCEHEPDWTKSRQIIDNYELALNSILQDIEKLLNR